MNVQVLKTIGALLLTTVFFVQCSKKEKIDPSSNLTSAEYPFKNIQAVDISDAFFVNLIVNDSVEEGVFIETNENALAYINVRKVNNTVEIFISENANFTNPPVLNAVVSAAQMTKIKASGASQIFASDTLIDSQLEVELSGASSFSGYVNSDLLWVQSSGASTAFIKGNSINLNLTLSGASQFSDFEYATQRLEANLSGASSASLTVEGYLVVTASGASTLRYKGAGVVSYEDLTGESTITKVK